MAVIFLAAALTLFLVSCGSGSSEETPQSTAELPAVTQAAPEPSTTSLSEGTTSPATPDPDTVLTEEADSGETISPATGLAAIIVSGDIAGVGKPFSFDATQSRAGDLAIAAYEWNMGDGTVLYGLTVQHAYTEPGEYTVTLTIVDEGGEADSTTKVVTVIELEGGGPPTAVISGPASAGAGEDVTFSAANSFPGGDPIVAYQWTSGDGHESGNTLDSIFTTSYEEPGAYIVELTVIDANDLNDRASMEIVIEFTLAGTNWEMNNPIRGTSVTLNFDEQSLSGNSGCNGYSAIYSISAWEDSSADISVQNISGTSQSCSQEVMHQEQAYLSILQSASRIFVDGSTLTMETRSGALTFSQVAP